MKYGGGRSQRAASLARPAINPIKFSGSLNIPFARQTRVPMNATEIDWHRDYVAALSRNYFPRIVIDFLPVYFFFFPSADNMAAAGGGNYRYRGAAISRRSLNSRRLLAAISRVGSGLRKVAARCARSRLQIRHSQGLLHSGRVRRRRGKLPLNYQTRKEGRGTFHSPPRRP